MLILLLDTGHSYICWSIPIFLKYNLLYVTSEPTIILLQFYWFIYIIFHPCTPLHHPPLAREMVDIQSWLAAAPLQNGGVEG